MTESGIALAAAYFSDVVAPLLASRLPGVRYAAARLGSGSDVLGLDDSISRDHDWGLRLTILVEDAHAIAEVDDLFDRLLPAEFRGHQTRFATTWHPTRQHQIEVATADDFAMSRLGLDPLRSNTAVDWLTLTGQSVLEVTAGPVFVDDVGRITDIRAAFSVVSAGRVALCSRVRLGEARSGTAAHRTGGLTRRRPRLPSDHRQVNAGIDAPGIHA